MSLVSSLKKVEKKNRKKSLTLAGVVLISFIEFSASFIKKEITLVNETAKISDINRIKIEEIEKDVVANRRQLQNIVTRLSFNAYIKHTDDRFKVINDTNERLLQNVGSLSGRVSGLEKIIYALNMFELKGGRRG